MKETGSCFKSPTKLTPPAPFIVFGFEDDEDDGTKKTQAVRSDKDTILYPTREEIEDQVIFNITRGKDKESP